MSSAVSNCSASPSTTPRLRQPRALAKEGKSTIKKTDESIVDAVILAGALETEHYEIAVYETLVTNADARGASEVATLLRANLQQEESARDKVKEAAQRISQTGIAVQSPAAG